MVTAAQPGMRVMRVRPLGMRDRGWSIGQGVGEGCPTTKSATVMAANTPIRPQNGVHEARAEPPRVPVGSAWAICPNRYEERRGGKEGVSTGRSRGSPDY